MKQDRQGVRTPADIERKYDLGKDYSKVMQTATDAKKTAERASANVSNLESQIEETGKRIDEVEETIENLEGGTSPTITVTDIDGGHRLTITDVNGTKTVDVMDGEAGKDGEDGLPGADGVGIADIYPVNVTDESGEVNIYDIYLDNGEVYEINVWNGKKGDPYTLTAADKQTIVDDVLTEIPFYEGDALEVYAGEVEEV